jgi:hypothetical protein
VGWQAVEGSFRDPSGFVYTRDGTLYRQINTSFAEHFEAFLASGLYDDLVRDGLLVAHLQVALQFVATDEAYAPQVSRLLLSRPDISPAYTKEGFERAFFRYFRIQTAAQIEDSERWLYRMSASPEASP